MLYNYFTDDHIMQNEDHRYNAKNSGLKTIATLSRRLLLQTCIYIYGVSSGVFSQNISSNNAGCSADPDDVMTWRRFPHNWNIVRGNPSVTGDSPHKGRVMRSIDVAFVASLKSMLNKQSSCRGNETICRPYDVTQMRDDNISLKKNLWFGATRLISEI